MQKCSNHYIIIIVQALNPQTNLSQALVATGFGYRPERRQRHAAGLVKLLPLVGDIRRMGGAALDLASVACGRVDAFFERGLATWDVAAGRILVAEAGGTVMSLAVPIFHSEDDRLVRPLEDLHDLGSHTVVIAAGPGIIEQLTELLIQAEAHKRP